MPKSMPTLDASRPIHRRADGLFLRMHVALRDVHVAMAGEIGQRPRVHVRRPAGEAGVPYRVELESLEAHASRPVCLRRIFVASWIALACCFLSVDDSI